MHDHAAQGDDQLLAWLEASSPWVTGMRPLRIPSRDLKYGPLFRMLITAASGRAYNKDSELGAHARGLQDLLLTGTDFQNFTGTARPAPMDVGCKCHK